MNTSNLGFGFIGAGAISGYAAGEISRHEHASVTAIFDTSQDRAREVAQANAIPSVCTSVEALLALDSVDAVYIAVPNKFHIPLTIQALEAGKHVLLEKPFALNAIEAARAVEAARSAGRVLNLGMNQRFELNSQKFRALARQGVFGDIYHAKAAWIRRAGIPKLGTWFGSLEMAGAGCLYDIGVHVLDLAMSVMDNFEPVSAFGQTYSQFGPRGLGEGNWGRSDQRGISFEVEDFATGIIRLSNGATITLDAAWACHMENPGEVEVEIFGTEGGGKLYKGEVYRRDADLDEHYTITDPHVEIKYPHRNRFHNFINHLLHSEPLCVTMEQALTTQRILDALRESAATGQSVAL